MNAGTRVLPPLAPSRGVAASAALLLAGPAAAGPGLLQPSLSFSTDYQSNPGFAVAGGDAATRLGVGIGLPIAWEAGRWALGLTSAARFARARGNDDSNDRNLALDGSVARRGERLTLSAAANYGETQLRDLDAVDLGLERADGLQRASGASLELRWLPSERESLSIGGSARRTRFDAAAGSPLLGSDDTTAFLSYARALGPRWTLLVSGGRNGFATEGRPGENASLSLQAGFAYVVDELWSVRATAGRSRLRSARGGDAVPGSVYQATIDRRGERGSLALGASQSFQSSAFGSVERRRSLTASWGMPLSPRLALSLGAARDDSVQAFSGIELDRRRSLGATANLSYALSESWSAGLTAGYQRSSQPASLLRLQGAAADSYSANLSLARSFGSVRLPSVLP